MLFDGDASQREWVMDALPLVGRKFRTGAAK